MMDGLKGERRDARFLGALLYLFSHSVPNQRAFLGPASRKLGRGDLDTTARKLDTCPP